LRGERVSSFLPFTSGAEWGSGKVVDIRFRLTTSPEAKRMMSVEGSDVMASPKIGESGDEDEVRVQMRYSAELDWSSSSSGGESGKICDSSKIITVCHYRHHSPKELFSITISFSIRLPQHYCKQMNVILLSSMLHF
jgi:hypothetical protein